jgi:hypothetical protein
MADEVWRGVSGNDDLAGFVELSGCLRGEKGAGAEQNAQRPRSLACYGSKRSRTTHLSAHHHSINFNSSVVSLKFMEEQPQILRLTTPKLKNVRGPDRSE